MMRTADTAPAALREEIEAHPAVNHLFLNRLATTPFSRRDYRALAEHFYPIACGFARSLERLLIRTPDQDARRWLVKVLADEHGERSRGAGPGSAAGDFLRATGSTMAQSVSARVPRAAAQWLAAHGRRVTREPYLIGLGAVGPGHEWAIPTMFGAVSTGLRRAGFSDDEIRGFTLRIEQARRRGKWLEEALASCAACPERWAQVRRGALSALAAQGAFWSEVQRAMVELRTPHNARLHGPATRPLAGELLLTAWDAFPAAQRLQAAFCAWRDRARPTLGEILQRTQE
jgi:pyrroloquinoline quinone (PQQ) biosynthesis protein C